MPVREVRRQQVQPLEVGTADTIRKRFIVFTDLTEPLTSYYRGAGLLRTIDGDKDIPTVSRLIFSELDGPPA